VGKLILLDRSLLPECFRKRLLEVSLFGLLTAQSKDEDILDEVANRIRLTLAIPLGPAAVKSPFPPHPHRACYDPY